MKNISPENCVPFLSSQSFESKYSFNLEKYTGRCPPSDHDGQSTDRPMSPARWIPDKKGSKYRVDDLDIPFIPNKIHGLELPNPNRFITTDFTLKHSLTSSLRRVFKLSSWFWLADGVIVSASIWKLNKDNCKKTLMVNFGSKAKAGIQGPRANSRGRLIGPWPSVNPWVKAHFMHQKLSCQKVQLN